MSKKKHKHDWQFAGFEGIYKSKWVCHCGGIKIKKLKKYEQKR